MATIYVSDVMDQVALTAEIQGWTEQYGPPEIIWQKTLVWNGVGEDDPVRWLARALQAAGEGMQTARVEGRSGPFGRGGTHTLSETGHLAKDVMG